ncbi:hypothetical protein OV208_40110 [Corallococcus sp. bb12-1]|uniref:hypothetical protein n=1 Tax=Corallococcus sp. bb12-1 TaxID=2996784 RepID=UPI002270D7FB|nr:hypothetical protein [Corallococcus sp. bb12-1]MCY1047573.1 hypothetical protein [Corallococcus sp. bb12-1]
MSACDAPTRARLFGVTAPQPWAWAVEVRNAPVLNLQRPPPPGVLGCYIAVCAAAKYSQDDASWMAGGPGVGAPRAEDLPMCAVVAVGRLSAVSLLWPDTARESRWHVGPVGLWLEDVVALPEPVACTPGPADTLWELPALVLAQVRLGFAAVAQSREARWRVYEALAASHGGREAATLKARVLRKCTCERAMTKCPGCRAWRCTAPTCPPHACGQQVSAP